MKAPKGARWIVPFSEISTSVQFHSSVHVPGVQRIAPFCASSFRATNRHNLSMTVDSNDVKQSLKWDIVGKWKLVAPLVLKVNNNFVSAETEDQLTGWGPASFTLSYDTSPHRRLLLKRRHQLHTLDEVWRRFRRCYGTEAAGSQTKVSGKNELSWSQCSAIIAD